MADSLPSVDEDWTTANFTPVDDRTSAGFEKSSAESRILEGALLQDWLLEADLTILET